MPHTPWTRERVDTVLTDLCRSPAGAFVLTAGELEQQLNWRRRFLAHDHAGWDCLVVRSQCRAGGESMSARISGLGWSRRRFEAGWRRAAAAIAAGLEAKREVNTAAIVANLDADERLTRSGRLPAILPQHRDVA